MKTNLGPVIEWLYKATAGIRFKPDRKAVRAELEEHLEDKAMDLRRIFPELTEEEVAEVAEITRTAMTVIRAVSGPAGFNLGMNQGEVAGAGIAAHLHQHVVPRWAGDANFLPIVGRTKALPILLADTRRLYAEAWPGGDGA